MKRKKLEHLTLINNLSRIYLKSLILTSLEIISLQTIAFRTNQKIFKKTLD